MDLIAVFGVVLGGAVLAILGATAALESAFFLMNQGRAQRGFNSPRQAPVPARRRHRPARAPYE